MLQGPQHVWKRSQSFGLGIDVKPIFLSFKLKTQNLNLKLKPWNSDFRICSQDPSTLLANPSTMAAPDDLQWD